MKITELMAEAKKLDPTKTAVYITLSYSWNAYDDYEDKYERAKSHSGCDMLVKCGTPEKAAGLLAALKSDSDWKDMLSQRNAEEAQGVNSDEVQTVIGKGKAILVPDSHEAGETFTLAEFLEMADYVDFEA